MLLLFITTTFAVIAKMCDRAGVLYAGELIEECPAALARPRTDLRNAGGFLYLARSAEDPLARGRTLVRRGSRRR